MQETFLGFLLRQQLRRARDRISSSMRKAVVLMMTSLETYFRRGQGAVRRWAAAAKVQAVLGMALAFLRGFLLSAGGLAHGIMPLGLGFLLNAQGMQTLAVALGSGCGFWLFWGKAGLQGTVWTALGLVSAWFLGRKPRSLPLMGSLGAFLTAVTGVLFQILFRDDTTIPLYLLRVAVGLGSAVIVTLYRERNSSWAGWAIQGIGVLALAQIWEPGFLLVGYLAITFPGVVQGAGKVPSRLRREEGGLDQARMEQMAGALERMRQELLAVPVPPIDESALTLRVRERACGGCPSRKICLQRLDPIPEDLLHRPLFDSISLPIPCKKPGRMILELRRAQEQLRAMKAQRDRLAEYRWAVQQQYQSLSHLLKQAGTPTDRERPCYRPEIALRTRSRTGANGDRCLWFPGSGDRYYVLLCDGMGTGLGAAQEATTGAELLRDLLQAGCTPEDALGSLNSLLALCGKAGALTVDLAMLELNLGRAAVYKWGAAPSWMIREGRGQKIGTATPPPGLSVQEGRETVTRLSLDRGEWLILLSDGVEGALAVEALEPEDGGSPGSLAAKFLEEGCPGTGDDATAVAIRLVPAPSAPPLVRKNSQTVETQDVG